MDSGFFALLEFLPIAHYCNGVIIFWIITLPHPGGMGAWPYMSYTRLFSWVDDYSSCQWYNSGFHLCWLISKSKHGLSQKVLCLGNLAWLLLYISVSFIFCTVWFSVLFCKQLPHLLCFFLLCRCQCLLTSISLMVLVVVPEIYHRDMGHLWPPLWVD